MIQFTRLRLFRAANTRLWRKRNRSILFEFNLFTFDRIIILTWSISRTHGGAAVWITRDIGYDIRSNIHERGPRDFIERSTYISNIIRRVLLESYRVYYRVESGRDWSIDRSIDQLFNCDSWWRVDFFFFETNEIQAPIISSIIIHASVECLDNISISK